MPAVKFTTLYGAVVEGEQYERATLQLYTAPIPRGEQAPFFDLKEPAIVGQGYLTGQRIADIFPEPIIHAGNFVRLTSSRFRWINTTPAPITIAGFALIAWLDKITPNVVSLTPYAYTWQPGGIIAGRVVIQASIYDEENP